jgi:hypothetical protein
METFSFGSQTLWHQKNTLFIVCQSSAGEIEDTASRMLFYRSASLQGLLLYLSLFNLPHK